MIESGLNPNEWRDVPLWEGTGCFECGGTGFRGRSAIHELLDLTDKIREMILNRRPTSEIKRAAKEDRMTFCRTRRWKRCGRALLLCAEINKVTFIEG
jgi:type IV pilus assembly protein PilB